MLILSEKRSEKLPCYTSLFLDITGLNNNIIDILKQTDNIIYNNTKKYFEIPVNKFQFVVELIKSVDTVKFIPYKETEIKNIKINKSTFKVKPFQHQLDAISYGINRDNGWILGDDCGLGKTASIIFLAQMLQKKEKLKHCLVICGINSIKYNWCEDIKKFSDLSYNLLGYKESKNGKISFKSISERAQLIKQKIDEFFVIINIQTLQSKEFIEAFKKSKNTFDLVVFDEAHKLTDPASKTAKNLLKITAKRCIALSGTPIKNDPKNAYLQLKWTGNINSTYYIYKNMYNVYGGFGNYQVIGHKNLELLNDLLNHCMLRRLKSEILDLPEKLYIKDYVELLPEQQKLYDDVQNEILIDLDKLDHIPTIIEELTINIRLRQISACPSIVSSLDIESAKLRRLKELVDQIVLQGDKVLIFNTFKKSAIYEQELLKEYNPLLCTGYQTIEEIEENKKQFYFNNDNKILIATWQKFGVGHTVVSANYVIFVDTPWNNADFEQAVDRIYRIGQQKTVFITTLISKNTYDERVQQLLDSSKKLSNQIIDNIIYDN